MKVTLFNGIGIGVLIAGGIALAEGQGVTNIVPSLTGGKTIKSEYGTVTIGGELAYPSSWPSDAPRYPGGSILIVTELSPQSPMDGVMVQFTTRDSRDAVVRFYKEALAKNGWQLLHATQTGGTMTVSAMKDRSRNFTAILTESDGEIKVIVSVGTAKPLK